MTVMQKKINIALMAKVGVLSAISIIIMLFEIPLWFAPPFYKLDLSEAIILVGGFALGPVAAVLIEFVKILLNLLFNGTQTAGVGELANFIMGVSLVLPAAIIYKYKKSLKGAIIGMLAGIVSLVIIGSVLNLYLLLPMYSTLYGLPLDAIIEMGSKLNPSIKNLNTFVLMITVPFNAVKGIACALLATLLYKRLSPILHKEFLKK